MLAPAYTRYFWAKSDRANPQRIHLLEHHMADVGACLEALLAQPTIRQRLARSGRRENSAFRERSSTGRLVGRDRKPRSLPGRAGVVDIRAIELTRDAQCGCCCRRGLTEPGNGPSGNKMHSAGQGSLQLTTM